jgi:long-chain acyl-CoA synthetase
MRVEEFLRSSARRWPGKTALVAGKLRPTFKDIDLASDRLAASFAASGVRRGDRVVVFMDNCIEAVVAIFATLKAGAVFSPVNASTKSEKLAYILKNCGASALVTQQNLVAACIGARLWRRTPRLAPSPASTSISPWSSTRPARRVFRRA